MEKRSTVVEDWGSVGVMQSNDETQRPPTVPGFSVRRLLGTGGAATVWLIRRAGAASPQMRSLPEEIALKLPHGGPEPHTIPRAETDAPTQAQSQAAPEDIRAELQAMEPLRHPHIVRAYGAVQTSRGTGLLLEPYTGGSLSALIRAEGRIGPGELVTVLSPVAEATAHLHGLGAVHGDISAGNILLAPDGRPALADLGEAQLLGTSLSERGTPGFMAPEREDLMRENLRRSQQEERSLSRRLARDLAPEADVYSLAAVCWFALTGERPPRVRERMPLSAHCPQAPPRLVRLLEEALAEHPEDRPSAGEFAHDLFRAAPAQPVDLSAHVDDEVLPELPTRLPDPQDGPRLRLSGAVRSRAVLAAAAAALLLGLGAAVWWGTSGDDVADSAVGHAEGTREADDLTPDPEAADTPEAHEALELLAQDEPVDALDGIVELRSEALSDPSSDLPQTYTVDDSPALTAERELMDTLHASQITYEDPALRIEPLDGTAEAPTTGDSHEIVAAAEDESVLDVRVSVYDVRTDQLHSQDVRLVLHRVEGRWLLYEVQDLDPLGVDAEDQSSPETESGPDGRRRPDGEAGADGA